MSSANAETIAPHAAIFAALGDPTRLSLLTRISDGQGRSISALSSDTRLTRQAVTKHLQVLEGAGLVAATRIGRESRYIFRPEPVVRAKSYLDAVSTQWDEALGRLKAVAERA